MMNRSIATTETSANDQRIKAKKSDRSFDNLFVQMADLCNSINNLSYEVDFPLDELFKSSKTTLGKLYQLFFSLQDKKDHLLNPTRFNRLIREKTEGLILNFNRTNQQSLNFIQFIKEIELLAKENQLCKEYLYKRLLYSPSFDYNSNRNNNALDFPLVNNNHPLKEYEIDFSRLKTYFIRHSGNESTNDQMSCSTFLQCISSNLQLNQIDQRFQLNDIFHRIYSLLVNEGVYIPASHRIDFHGFLLCLEEIAQIFSLNLKTLIKTLIYHKK